MSTKRRALKTGLLAAVATSALGLQAGTSEAATGNVWFYGNHDATVQTAYAGPKGSCVDLAVNSRYTYRYRVFNNTNARIRVFYTPDCRLTGLRGFPGPRNIDPRKNAIMDGIYTVKSVQFLG